MSKRPETSEIVRAAGKHFLTFETERKIKIEKEEEEMPE